MSILLPSKSLAPAETVFLAEFYDLTIETGILLFEAVDLDFREFGMDAGVQLFEAIALLTEVVGF